MSELLIHKESNRRIFKELFLKGHNLAKPIVPLNHIVHWKAHMDMIGCNNSFLGREPTLFFGGYIYNFTTPAIRDKEIQDEIKYGIANGASLYLVPTIRDIDDCSDLIDAGFKKLPCFVESVFEIEGESNKDIKERVGSKRMKEILRLHKKACREYDLKYFTGPEVKNDGALMDLASNLHNENIKKYSYPVNFYNREVIETLANSALSEKLIIGIRYDRKNKLPIQVMIYLVSVDSSEIYYLVQGIDHKLVPKDQNLYVTAVYDAYLFARKSGIKTMYLGRGGHEEKAKLGANKFYLLNHWIRSDTKNIDDETKKLSEKTLKIIGPDNNKIPIIAKKQI